MGRGMRAAFRAGIPPVDSARGALHFHFLSGWWTPWTGHIMNACAGTGYRPPVLVRENLVPLRLEFVNRAFQTDTNVRQLRQKLGISPTIGASLSAGQI